VDLERSRLVFTIVVITFFIVQLSAAAFAAATLS
jgi:hypothetical protein